MDAMDVNCAATTKGDKICLRRNRYKVFGLGSLTSIMHRNRFTLFVECVNMVLAEPGLILKL
eukprot:scaffold31276_cov79-Cyclotella_meneghiniana.AAC.2